MDTQRQKYLFKFVLKQSQALLNLAKNVIEKTEQMKIDWLFLYLILANLNSCIIQH